MKVGMDETKKQQSERSNCESQERMLSTLTGIRTKDLQIGNLWPQDWPRLTSATSEDNGFEKIIENGKGTEDVEVIAAKNRNGSVGTVKLAFQKSCGRFEEI